MLIEVKNLTKRYGKNTAVDNISFVVNDGEIVGFLGPNGAGKTTTMNMMTGYIAATGGDVNINGFDILKEPEKAKKQIGYLPDTPPLYGDMRVYEYLDFVCDIKDIPRKERKAMLDEIYETVKIKDVRKRIIKNLSKGYRQRVGLAQALVGFPDALILDEPTVGLDPKQIMEMRDVIKELGQRHTVILSSHILHEVSAVCDKLIIIDNGKIVVQKRTDEFENMSSEVFNIRVKASKTKDEMMEIFSGFSPVFDGIKEEGTFDFSIYAKDGHNDRREEIFRICAGKDIPVLMFKPVIFSLEDLFLKVINGEYAEESDSLDLDDNKSEEVFEFDKKGDN
ncbi:MAG: ABC transporter ATP-binding protein [Clostridiales bacterium]|nr:ABC transporter ATP-binding protein [Clostridiales bacterium]